MNERAKSVEIPLEKTDGPSLWLPRLALIAGLATAPFLLALLVRWLPTAWAAENPVALGLLLTVVGAAFLTVLFFGARALLITSRRSLRLVGDTLEVIRGGKRTPVVRAPLRDVHVACRTHRYRTANTVSPVLTIAIPGYEELHLTVDDDTEDLEWRRRLPETEEAPSYVLGAVPWRRLLRALGIEEPMTSAPA